MQAASHTKPATRHQASSCSCTQHSTAQAANHGTPALPLPLPLPAHHHEVSVDQVLHHQHVHRNLHVSAIVAGAPWQAVWQRRKHGVGLWAGDDARSGSPMPCLVACPSARPGLQQQRQLQQQQAAESGTHLAPPGIDPDGKRAPPAGKIQCPAGTGGEGGAAAQCGSMYERQPTDAPRGSACITRRPSGQPACKRAASTRAQSRGASAAATRAA